MPKSLSLLPRHCESALLLPSPHSEWLSRRMEALVLVGTAANDMGFEEEALHDSLLIADRAAAAGIPVPHSQAALVLLGASLQVVASQVPIMAISPPPGLYPMSPPMTAASALVAHLERAGGLAAGSTADMSRRIAAALSGDLRAISALRCLKLYLERLGYEGQAATKVMPGVSLAPSPRPPYPLPMSH